jgi:hypothetical protein
MDKISNPISYHFETVLIIHSTNSILIFHSFYMQFMISQRKMLCKTGIPEMSVFNITYEQGERESLMYRNIYFNI